MKKILWIPACALAIAGIGLPLAFNKNDGNTKAVEVDVATFEELKSSLASEGDMIIRITDNIEVTESLLTGNGDYVIYCDSDFSVARGSEMTDDLFVVAEEGELTLGQAGMSGKLTIDGNSSVVTAAGSLVDNDGTLIVNENVVLTNNFSSESGTAVANSAIFTMNGGEISNNKIEVSGKYGAIYTAPNSTFTMKGGKIENNTTYGSGAAIFLNTGAISEITGGTISGNTSTNGNGGAINAKAATLELKGGTISGNKAAKGGALYGYENAQLNLSGGVISANESSDEGGAISVKSQATAKLKGTEISENSSVEGGALHVDGANAVIDGSIIKENTVTSYGAGLYVSGSGSVVELSSGSILKNTSAKSGAGVFISSGTFTLSGTGLISENATQSGNGGGVVNKDNFIMKGGKISDNSCVSKGGGIYSYTESYTLIEGGEITGNNTESYGGGICVDYTAEAEVKGGKIYGNSATSRGNNLYAMDSQSSAEKTNDAVVTITGGEQESVDIQYALLRIGGNVDVETTIRCWAGIKAAYAYIEVIEDLANKVSLIPQKAATETSSTANPLVRIAEDAMVNPYNVANAIEIDGYYLKVDGKKLLRTPCDYKISQAFPVATTVQAGANEGDVVSFSAIKGYEISNVKVNGTEVTASEGVYSFTMPAANVELAYDVTLADLDVGINENAQGFISVKDKAKIGENLEISLVENNEFRVTKVYYIYNGKNFEIAAKDGKYTTKMFDGIEIGVEKVSLYSVQFAENEYLEDAIIKLGDNEVSYAAQGDNLNLIFSSNSTRYLIDAANSYYMIAGDETKYPLANTLEMPAANVEIHVAFTDIYQNFENIVEVNDFESLKAALQSGSADIIITENIEISSMIEVGQGSYTIISDGARSIKRAAGYTGSLFLIDEQTVVNLGAEGVIDNINTITFDGNSENVENINGSIFTVINSGELYINSQAKITNNAVETTNWAFETYGYGSATMGGSAVYSYSGRVFLNGGEISGHSSTLSGGAIYNMGYFEINSGKICDNFSSSSGGAIYSLRAITMNGGEISNNTTTYMSGAIHLANSHFAVFTFNGGRIADNSATKSGGALYVGMKAIFYMNGGTFENNSSNGNGGAIYVYGKSMIRDGLFKGNFALSSSGKGGAIYVNSDDGGNIDGTLILTGGKFEANKAVHGGAVALYSDASLDMTKGDVEFVGNEAKDRGGAIYLFADKAVGPSVALITTGKFESNIAKDGIDIAVQYSVLKIGGEVELSQIETVANQTATYGYIEIVDEIENKFILKPNKYEEVLAGADNFIRVADGVEIANILEKVEIEKKGDSFWRLREVGEEVLLCNGQFAVNIAEGIDARAIDVSPAADSGEIVAISPRKGYTISNLKLNGQPLSENTFTMPDGDVELSYDYQLISYDMTVEGAENGSVTLDKQSATIGQEITLTINANEGYFLKTLKINGTIVEVEGNSLVFTVDGNITISAEFEKNVYMVGFNYCHDGKFKIEKVEHGEKIIEETPARKGYVFDGWYTDSEYEEKFDFNSAITKVVQLYAKWIKI